MQNQINAHIKEEKDKANKAITEDIESVNGHIESDEEAPYCAVREIKEESGIWAGIVKNKDEKNLQLVGK